MFHVLTGKEKMTESQRPNMVMISIPNKNREYLIHFKNTVKAIKSIHQKQDF